MVSVLAREQVCQQARPRQSLRDRPDHRWPGGREPLLARPVACPAGVRLADVLKHEVTGGAVVELLADLLADADARPAATGAGPVRLGQVIHDALARQVIWQRLAPVPVPFRLVAFDPLVPRHPRLPGLAALRAAAEVQPQRLVEAVPQLLVVLAQPRVLLAQAAHLLQELA